MNLKKKIIDNLKRSSLLTACGYNLRKFNYHRKMMNYVHNELEDKVLFYRGGKAYADNQRPISLYLHEHAPDMQQVWVCSGKAEVQTLPDFVRPVIQDSTEYYVELSTAKVWVSSNIMPDGIIKKKGQLYIQTWHGDRGFKKMANDALDNEQYRKRKRVRKLVEADICDYFVTGSKMAEKNYRSAFGYKGAFLTSGCPRNDCLFVIDDVRCKDIRRKLRISDDVKIVLYAPTFRDHSKSQGYVDSNIDLVSIIKMLEAKNDKQWVLLKRAHGAGSLRSQIEIENKIIDVTRYPDMADLLMISDFLITDYSSCAPDFAITGRPILIYQDDYDRYVSKDRTLYFRMEDSPYWCARDMEEAQKIISSITPEAAKRNDHAILEFYGTYENGLATEAVSKVILDWITGAKLHVNPEFENSELELV